MAQPPDMAFEETTSWDGIWFLNFLSFLFHAKMFNSTVPSAISAISPATNGKFCQSSSQRASCVFLCLKSKFHWFVYNQKIQIKLISHIFSTSHRHKWYIRTGKKSPWPSPSAREYLVTGILRILYLLPAYYYNPMSAKGSEKKFLPKFRPWHDSNHKRATKINTTTNNNNIDKSYIWLHWHVSLTRLMFTYLLWSVIAPCESRKNSYHSFSLWPPPTAQQLPPKSCTLIT